MLAWYLSAASGGIALGALGALVFAYLLAETLLKIYDKLENPSLDPADAQIERTEVVAVRDLLIAATIVGGFNGGEDANLRHALGGLRLAANHVGVLFEDRIEDLDDEPEDEHAKAAVDA